MWESGCPHIHLPTFFGGDNVAVGKIYLLPSVLTIILPHFFVGGENVDEGKRMYGMRADIESSGCRVAVALRSQASQNLSF